jgi:NADH dehydrogenase [ubiquinone] 1 alpha subcomplex assembly factor 7
MALALMDPDYGYYAHQDPFGEEGDFITAPEVSQMFGELLGLWLVEAWRDQGSASAVHLIELGPGRGTMMADVLRATLRVAPEFLAAAEVTLIEASPRLRTEQEQRLAAAPARLSWSSTLKLETLTGPLFVLANEFFDALPVRQFLRVGEKWHERLVTLGSHGELEFAIAPMATQALAPPPGRPPARAGDLFEHCPSALALCENLAATIARQGGAALIVDYGYDAMAGFGDTLQALRRHRYVPVLQTPGEADVTAHVDFAALALAARHGGAAVYGPRPQGPFLTALGIEQRCGALIRSAPDAAGVLSRQLNRLCGKDEMGQLFKALALLPQHAPMPAGF